MGHPFSSVGPYEWNVLFDLPGQRSLFFNLDVVWCEQCLQVPWPAMVSMEVKLKIIHQTREGIRQTQVWGQIQMDQDCRCDGLPCVRSHCVQGEFHLKNAEDGVLSSMFMIGMSIAIPVCSEAVYHVNAFRLAGVSLLIWTVATICCGLSFDFYSIAFCRMFVGVGEAAIISLAPPYIGHPFPFSICCLMH